MSNRYFVSPSISGDKAVLTGSEAHHAINVMRLAPGAQVVLFDGSGAEFVARVEKVGRVEVELAVVSREAVDRELPIELILGVTLPKGDRQRWLVEKAVELGVRRLVPLVTARSVARPTEKAIARLQRTVIEASKQCGRNRLLEIDDPRGWAEFIATSRDVPCRLLAHPDASAGTTDKSISVALPSETAISGGVFLAVGPEGGFSDDEVKLATTAGWQSIDLGPRTLRIETAAILLVARVTQHLR